MMLEPGQGLDADETLMFHRIIEERSRVGADSTDDLIVLEVISRGMVRLQRAIAAGDLDEADDEREGLDRVRDALPALALSDEAIDRLIVGTFKAN